MKFYPRYYQLLSSGNKVINSTNAELAARRMLRKLQTIDKKSKVIVYDRVGIIIDEGSIRYENNRKEIESGKRS